MINSLLAPLGIDLNNMQTLSVTVQSLVQGDRHVLEGVYMKMLNVSAFAVTEPGRINPYLPYVLRMCLTKDEFYARLGVDPVNAKQSDIAQAYAKQVNDVMRRFKIGAENGGLNYEQAEVEIGILKTVQALLIAVHNGNIDVAVLNKKSFESQDLVALTKQMKDSP